MQRMQGVSPNELDTRQEAIAAEIAAGPRGRVGTLMQLWLHSPDVAEHAQRLGAYFRTQNNIPAQLMEMAILITARAWRCEYEWVQHEPVARQKGLAPSIIDAVRRGDRPQFRDSGAEAVYDFASMMLAEREVSDEVFSRVLALYGERGVVDLSVLIGHYIHGAILLNAVRVPAPIGSTQPFT